MKCPKCNKEIPKDSNFCEQCGAEINEDCVDRTTHVDVRWALLPAMLIATFAMWLLWLFCMFGDKGSIVDSSLFVMPASLISFLITLWCGIRKKVALSFVLIMVVLFLSNCVMLYGCVCPHEERVYSAYISWKDENCHYNDVTLANICWVDNQNRMVPDGLSESEILQRLKLYQQSLSSLIQQNGAQDIYQGSVSKGRSCYYATHDDWAIACLCMASGMFVLYVIYAFVAYKKKWTF